MKLWDVVGILCVALTGGALLFYATRTPPGSFVEIITPTGEYRYSLEKDRLVTVPGREGPYRFEIKGGKIRAVEAVCPNQVCVHRGWIEREGDSIVCVPNGVVARIVGKGQVVDAVTE